MLSEVFSVIVSTALTFTIETIRSRAKIRQIRKSYQLPYQVPTEDRRSTTLLIGLGGVGKTQLIKSLLNNKNANPKEKTKGFDIYYSSYNPGVFNLEKVVTKEKKRNQLSTNYWLFIADYKGQNLGTLISSFILQQKREYSPLAYSHITSLILVVDLYSPKVNKTDDDIAPQESIDEKRVHQNLNEWNDTAIDAVFGLITEEIEYVCLFINKVDLMSKRSVKDDEFYIQKYEEIKKRMDKRLKGKSTDILLGSAQEGTGISILREKLMETSVIQDKKRFWK